MVVITVDAKGRLDWRVICERNNSYMGSDLLPPGRD
jgi:hypothetical protein